MANNKWVKWCVGLSGAALFAGFVGFISREDPAAASAGGQADGTISNNEGSDQTPQYDDSFGYRGRRGGDFFGSDGTSGSIGSGGSDGSSSELGGRMRTRAS
ncbi:hypothetical protein [Cohnella zeiphila]|uniref:Uncharacterized protein n=1 Tax=Cohnella zeiphila TaxID=2761120 RepID=A0A7X0SS03_9BACL|nr:hypothetical protein [Cohnella zeiphila]MBB6735031.1 hypothetical protein [Cohnella zeiphila]